MESTRNLTYLNAHQIDYGMVKLKQIIEYNPFNSLIRLNRVYRFILYLTFLNQFDVLEVFMDHRLFIKFLFN